MLKYRTESTFTNITSNFTFTDENITKSLSTETLSDVSGNVNLNSLTLNSLTNSSYTVTVNIFSENVETYNGTVNSTTALGPIGFDCYDTVTAATTVDFTTNQITFDESNGSSLPSWLTFDTSTANVSISNPSEIYNGTYTLTNTYTGVLGNTFTLQNNAIISLSEEVVNSTTNNENKDDDDHCLNASSKGLCAFFIFLIIVGALIPVIFIGVFLYCKLKKSKNLNKNNMTRVNQSEANEPEYDQDNNAPIEEQQDDAPNIEIMGMHRITHPQDNKV